ncbi:AraC family transcriptional regulator [Ottowia sp. VDI28]|uniref:AraC family transcriptional regulator n=1 Tax=Ottowia sp. VDI28 TaxID=3133968 RepID=UPI003C2B8E27
MDMALQSNAQRLPLERFRLFDSHDLDEAREFVGRVFCPHVLATLHPGTELDACHHSVPLHRDTSLNYVQYGPAVRIEPGHLGGFYLLQIPLRGGATVRCGSQTLESHPLMASLPSPTEPLSMRWHEDSPQFIVKIEREALHNRLSALLQAPVPQPLVFDLGVDLAHPALMGMASFIAYLRSAAETNAILLGHPVLAEQAENHLLTNLLLSTQHNYSAALAAKASTPGAAPVVLPRAVKRAQEFMRGQLEQPITLVDVCAHVGVSARSLQQSFAQCTGKSPMSFLRDLRLDAVRAALQQPTALERAPQVSDIAARYGFFHLGHFAESYRKRFGETPSDTRQRQSKGGPSTSY